MRQAYGASDVSGSGAGCWRRRRRGENSAGSGDSRAPTAQTASAGRLQAAAEWDPRGAAATFGRTTSAASVAVARSAFELLTDGGSRRGAGEPPAPRRLRSGVRRLRQLHPLVVPQDSQTKQEPAGRIRTPQVEQ